METSMHWSPSLNPLPRLSVEVTLVHPIIVGNYSLWPRNSELAGLRVEVVLGRTILLDLRSRPISITVAHQILSSSIILGRIIKSHILTVLVEVLVKIGLRRPLVAIAVVNEDRSLTCNYVVGVESVDGQVVGDHGGGVVTQGCNGGGV